MSAKQDALIEILDTMKHHGLTVGDIADALKDAPKLKAQKSGSVISRLFGYIGGIFVFAGLAIYIAMQWEDFGSAARVMMTLGIGFCVFLMALACTTDDRLDRAATPLFLVAAFLQPGGIIVMLQEYSRGGDPAHGLLFMNLAMLIQQGLTFKAKDRSVLALAATFFGASFFAIAFDLIGMKSNLIGITIGFSLCCIAWAIDNSRHKPVAAINYFFGSILFLGACYDVLRHSPYEILFLGLSCATIFASTQTRSRTLLLVGTLALLAYIGDFMFEHFKDNLNAPLALMLMGFLLIGLGALAVRINNKYIRQQEG